MRAESTGFDGPVRYYSGQCQGHGLVALLRAATRLSRTSKATLKVC